MPVLISGAFDIHVGGDFDVTIPYSRLMIVCVTLVLMIALTLFISHSRMGRACRACAEDMKMANLLGIDTNRVISFTFVLGAMLAAVGGVLIGLTIGKLNRISAGSSRASRRSPPRCSAGSAASGRDARRRVARPR